MKLSNRTPSGPKDDRVHVSEGSAVVCSVTVAARLSKESSSSLQVNEVLRWGRNKPKGGLLDMVLIAILNFPTKV